MTHSSPSASDARVGDPKQVRDAPRPKAVVIAGGLILLSVVIAGVDGATDTSSGATFFSKTTIFWYIVIMLLAAGLVRKLLQGRNWARVTYAVILVPGIPNVISNIREITIAPTTFQIVFLLQTIIQLAALVLLFSPGTRVWFGSQQSRVPLAR